MHIRDATLDDAAAIARIYNQGIEERIATLETELRTPDDRARWLAERTARYPVIVAAEGIDVVGWASLNRFNPRPVYGHVADFSVYVDASEADVRQWYVDRFLALRRTAFADEDAYFHRFAALSDEQARETALAIWAQVNGPNLRDNIAPTRSRARLVLQKAGDHQVRRVLLRKL